MFSCRYSTDFHAMKKAFKIKTKSQPDLGLKILQKLTYFNGDPILSGFEIKQVKYYSDHEVIVCVKNMGENWLYFIDLLKIKEIWDLHSNQKLDDVRKHENYSMKGVEIIDNRISIDRSINGYKMPTSFRGKRLSSDVDNVISFEVCDDGRSAGIFMLVQQEGECALLKSDFDLSKCISTAVGKQMDLDFKVLQNDNIHHAKLTKERNGVIMKAKKFKLLDAANKKWKWEKILLGFGLEDDGMEEIVEEQDKSQSKENKENASNEEIPSSTNSTSFSNFDDLPPPPYSEF